MSKPINEHLIQLTGKASVDPKEYETGEDVTLLVKGSVYNVSQSDNHDGTNDLIVKVKATEVRVASEQNE